MAEVKVLNFFNPGESRGIFTIPEEFSRILCAKRAVQMVYYADFALRYKSFAHTKERADVSGSTRKIFRQKGTGNARHGAIRATQFRGGGTVFGPRYSEGKIKINKKMRAVVTASVINDHIKRGTLFVVNDLNMDSPKTKTVFSAGKAFFESLCGAVGKVPFVNSASRCLAVCDAENSKNFILSSRNLSAMIPISGFSSMSLMDIVRNNFIIVEEVELHKIIGYLCDRAKG